MRAKFLHANSSFCRATGLRRGTGTQMEPGLFLNLKVVQAASNFARAMLAGSLDTHSTPGHPQQRSKYLPRGTLYGHSHQYSPHSPSFSRLEACSTQSHARDKGRRSSTKRWTDRQRSHEYSCCGSPTACRFRLR